MDRNDLEYNNKYANEKETERILRRRDREKYLEELSELESEEASCWNKIFLGFLSLLIVNPAAVAGTVYYFWTEVNSALMGGSIITNLGSQLKWVAIGFAAAFAFNSLTLIYYFWKISNLKSQMAKIKRKIYRLDQHLFRQ